MITKEQRDGLLKHIGSKHISKISKYFYQRRIVNRDGDPYHHVTISEAFNGRKPNPKIEDGIWEFAVHLKEEKEKDAQRKAEILAPIKTEKK